MPNGLSARFSLSRQEVTGLLELLPPDTEVGSILTRHLDEEGHAVGRYETLTAAGMLEMLEGFRRDRIGVDEHDETYYVIRLDYRSDFDISKWVTVTESSNLFTALRERRHLAWKDAE